MLSSLVVALFGLAAAPTEVPVEAPARDQAYVVPLAVAKAAVALLGLRHGVWAYCEPCGDASPEWTAFAQVSAQPWEGGDAQWVVTLDGEGIDLAYTYVALGEGGPAVNVALLTGMAGVERVSPVIPIEQ